MATCNNTGPAVMTKDEKTNAMVNDHGIFKMRIRPYR
jgi:hypothetical protein